MIKSPRQLAPYADRDLDCQQALESTFNQVIMLAGQYGWSTTEAAQAIQELAFNRLAAEEENRLTTLSIEQHSYVRH